MTKNKSENSSTQKAEHVRVTGGTRTCCARNTSVLRALHERVTVFETARFVLNNREL